MRQHRRIVAPSLAGLVLFGAGVWYGRADSEGGARTVDASAYDTLQEAFDALPAEGGIVRIPPGRYEIDQPLHLKRSDTRIEGAGHSYRQPKRER